MSDKKSRDLRERRLYRRHRRNERGVSPVVATIILVAIAVAAAAALYIFIQGYQSKLQSGISSNSISSQFKFSIGGSTTVFPMSQLGIKWFEANNSEYNITDQQGGSVAGAEAYCAGQVDVGAASSSFTLSQLTGDGCSSSLAAATVQNVIGLDAIVGIASTSNPIFGTGGYAASFTGTTYSDTVIASGNTYVNITLPAPGGTIKAVVPALSTTTVAATTSNSGVLANVVPSSNTLTTPLAKGYSMNYTVTGTMGGVAFSLANADIIIPATFTAPVTLTGTSAGTGGQYGGTISATATTIPFSFNASTMLAIYVADSSTVPTQNSPGGLNGLASIGTIAPWLCGVAPANLIDPSIAYAYTCPTIGAAGSFAWGDIPFPAGCASESGATWSFAGCSFATANTNKVTAYDRLDSSGTEQGFVQKYLLTGAYLAKDGSSNSCGTDNQLVSCHITVTHENGNPALLSAVAGDKNGLGFNSFGFASAPGSGVSIAGYYGSSNTGPVLPSITNVLGAYRGTLSASQVYGPWRVLEYLTNGVPPSGSAISNYLGFVLGPQVNLDLCSATGYISLYAA